MGLDKASRLEGQPDSPLELGEPLRQSGDLYNRLEREVDFVARYPFLFSEAERDNMELAQAQALEYGRRFLDVGGKALHSTDAEEIGRDYEALVRFGRETLATFTLFRLRIGDYLEACQVLEDLKGYGRSHRIHLSSTDTESIVEYGRQVAELARDFAAGTMQESKAFRQLAVSGRRLIELFEDRLQSKSAPSAVPPSPGLWSARPSRSIPLDRVDAGALPAAEDEDAEALPAAEDEDAEALPAAEDVIPTDGAPPVAPPAPTEFPPQSPSEVELVLEQRRLSLTLNETRLAQKDAQATLDIMTNGSRVRRFVRNLFGKENQDRKAVFEARKQVAAHLTRAQGLTRSLKEVEDRLKILRKDKASSRSPEFALEPQRLQLNGAIATNEAELKMLHRQLGRVAPGPERDGLAERFSDVQRVYRDHLDELARVEKDLYGQPLDRITSSLRDFNPTAGHGSVTMAGVPIPGVASVPISVSSAPVLASAVSARPHSVPRTAPRSAAPRSTARLSPSSGGVLLSPSVPEWEEWHERRARLAESFGNSRTLRDAMHSLPPSKIPRPIKGKSGADRPLYAVPRVVSDPGKVVPADVEARNHLMEISPSHLSTLRRTHPLAGEILVKGAQAARNHMRVQPFDFDEYERLDRRRDVLPAKIQATLDKIEALEAITPTGFLARAKQALFGGGRARQIESLRSELASLQAEEESVHARLEEMNRQAA